MDEQLRSLSREMSKQFDLEQLADFVTLFDLELTELEGNGRSEKIGYLIEWLEDQGILPELFVHLREERPTVSWEKVMKLPEQVEGGHITHIYGDQVKGDLVYGDKYLIEHATFIWPESKPQNDMELRMRVGLLQRVNQYWIEGVLHQSLLSEGEIELDVSHAPAEVERPWMIRRAEEEHGRIQIDGQKRPIDLLPIFGGSMLILGAPGSGKTITLLQLADDLIKAAKGDERRQIPIIFNLSSWAEERFPLEDWLVQQLHRIYYLSEKFGRNWLEKEPFIFLLDGLDEVQAEWREQCIEAINLFQQDHLLTQLVVCSRLQDYQLLMNKLKMGGAIEIQPLNEEKVNDYFTRLGEKLLGVRGI